FKEFECRSWPTRHRGPLLIHAAALTGAEGRRVADGKRCESAQPGRGDEGPQHGPADCRGGWSGRNSGGGHAPQVRPAPPPRRERISNHNLLRSKLAGLNRTPAGRRVGPGKKQPPLARSFAGPRQPGSPAQLESAPVAPDGDKERDGKGRKGAGGG